MDIARIPLSRAAHAMTRTRTLIAGSAAVLVAGGAAVASGAVSAPGLPPAKSLAQAIHDAAVAPDVKGVTARITFTNKLIDSSSLAGSGPLLVGASGRLWISPDGRARVELQSDRGDAQLTTDGKTVTLYDASSNTAYTATLPAEASGHASDHPEATTPPSVAKISDVLTKVGTAVGLSGADPAIVGGASAYSVKVTPKNGGLVGKAELAWDAATGVPLRAGIYATGSTKPVLELAASDISYGPVDEAALSVPVPAGAKVETIDLPATSKHDEPSAMDKAKFKAEVERRKAMTPADVAKALPFTLSAPETLAGQARSSVKLVGSGEHQGALVTYGTGLGGIAVLEMAGAPGAATATPAPAPKPRRHGSGGSSLVQIPTIDVNGAKATQLATALGTLTRFERGGVQFTLAGSVTAAVATTAARGL